MKITLEQFKRITKIITYDVEDKFYTARAEGVRGLCGTAKEPGQALEDLDAAAECHFAVDDEAEQVDEIMRSQEDSPSVVDSVYERSKRDFFAKDDELIEGRAIKRRLAEAEAFSPNEDRLTLLDELAIKMVPIVLKMEEGLAPRGVVKLSYELAREMRKEGAAHA